jgi:hypothetical protein
MLKVDTEIELNLNKIKEIEEVSMYQEEVNEVEVDFTLQIKMIKMNKK